MTSNADYVGHPDSCSQVIGYSPEDKEVPGPLCIDPEGCDRRAFCALDYWASRNGRSARGDDAR